jgi:hypothetical protein
VIAELAKHHKIAQIQIRLIVLEMEKLELDDKYGLDRHQQEKLFVSIATRVLNVPERAICQLL